MCVPKLSLVAIVVGSLLASCVSADDEEDPDSLASTTAALGCGHCGHSNEKVRIAWLGSDPTNTYDAANRQGVIDVSHHDHHSTVSSFYSFFDPAAQLAQCLDVVHRHKHDAIVIIPTDAVGIVPCVTAARHRGIPVVAVDLPIGPDTTTIEPQVPGQAGAVLVPAQAWPDELTPLVVDLCAAQSPCNVVYLAGSFDVAFDQVALASLDAAAASHPGLHIVAREQAFYDRGLAFSLTQDILAAHPDVDVIIGAGDQMAQGAEDAIAATGSPGTIAIIGAGAGAYGIQAVRDGRWFATFMALPYDEGSLGADIALDAARCSHFDPVGVDPVEAHDWPAFFTIDNQNDFAGFVPQWPG